MAGTDVEQLKGLSIGVRSGNKGDPSKNLVQCHPSGLLPRFHQMAGL
jgi:hypothetical protein